MALTFYRMAGHEEVRAEDRGILQRVVERFIAVRELEARRRVGAPLQAQDDNMLRSLGYRESEIARIHAE